MKSLHFGAASSCAAFWLAVASSLFFAHPSSAQGGSHCQPYKWNSNSLQRVAAADEPVPTEGVLLVVKPGEINCRYWADTTEEVNYYTCSQLAHRYEIPNDVFFMLNPGLNKDCSNIKPKSEYCVTGFIEPIRAFDGLCGPRHNNATCQGTDKPCCNADTWTCGDSAYVAKTLAQNDECTQTDMMTPPSEDCAPGICYEGYCLGDTIYSTDGTCGRDYGNRDCVGRWGSCCSMDGRCGTGDAFCSLFTCQQGDCDIWKQDEQPAGTKWTKDGTCGGAGGQRCSAEWGRCCNVNGVCGEKPADCYVERGWETQSQVAKLTFTQPGWVWNLRLQLDIGRVHVRCVFQVRSHFDCNGPGNRDFRHRQDFGDSHKHLHGGSLSSMHRRHERAWHHR
ncbi:glycosyl hydrolase family 18 [Colletotrichum higginsianum]|nr:glycosyl hydrolase family 18 [Colletotrichum higginsianum]